MFYLLITCWLQHILTKQVRGTVSHHTVNISCCFGNNNKDQISKKSVIYRILYIWWVLINMAPRKIEPDAGGSTDISRAIKDLHN